MTPITQREKEKVLDFIRSNAVSNLLQNPLPQIVTFLQVNFVWTVAQSKKRASEIVEDLGRSGKVICQTDDRGSVETISINGSDSNPVQKTKPILVKTKAKPPVTCNQPEIPEEIPENNGNIKREHEFISSRKTRPRKTFKKGAARRNREAYNKGDRNEQRFHRLMEHLMVILKEKLPSTVIEAHYFKSGRHNPENGQIDLQDKQGEDGSPKLTVRKPCGRFFTGRIIYDPKSSYPAVVRFNRHIRYLPGQEGALMKKAIRITPKRTDREIIEEVVCDMIQVELLLPEEKEVIISCFSEI